MISLHNSLAWNFFIHFLMQVLLVFQVTNEEDVIPGWEGKIVAWIEEDHG